MAKENPDQVTHLFNQYATNLSFHLPQFQDLFLCPLCFRLFDKEAIARKELSREHIIPSSLGGRLVSLTCTQCNNQHGTQLDAHLVKKLRTDDILRGESDSPLRATVGIGAGEQTADVFFSSDSDPNVRIMGIRELSNPELHQYVLDELQKESVPTINMRANLGYSKPASSVAVVRAGYLLSFYTFGYGYVLYEHARLVRKQILRHEQATNVLKGLIKLDSSAPANVIGLLKEPEDLQCFVAILDLSTEIERRIGVVLPGFGSAAADIYKRWSDVYARDEWEITPVITPYEYDPRLLIDPDFRHAPFHIWETRYDTTS